MSRRTLFARASALGMSATAITSLLAERNFAYAQDTPTPAPTQTPIAITSNEGAKVRIQYWTILSGPDGDEMSALVQKFSDENPDIGVDSLQGLLDFVPKLQAAGISGTAPDVALLRHYYIGAFASKGVLSPLTPEELSAAGINLAVPVTASYIMCAVIAAPALIKLGVPDYAAHMFIFYYAVLSEVSPPTALSPFAAAAITGGSPYLTTLQAWKYTMPAFLVPFVFVCDPLRRRVAAADPARAAAGSTWSSSRWRPWPASPSWRSPSRGGSCARARVLETTLFILGGHAAGVSGADRSHPGSAAVFRSSSAHHRLCACRLSPH